MTAKRVLLASFVASSVCAGDAAAQDANRNTLPTIEVVASPITRRDTGTAGMTNLADLLDQAFSAVTTMTTEQVERQSGGALGNGGL